MRPRAFRSCSRCCQPEGALPLPVLDRQQLLVTVGGGSDDDQHARAVLLQADVEVEGIGPQVDVALAVQVALAPGGELLLPHLLQPDDVGRRQPDDAVAQNRPQSVREGVGGNPLQVEQRDQGVDARRAPQIRRQDGTGEVLPRAPVMDPRLAHRDLADPGHQLALRVIAVAHHQALALVVPQGLEAPRVLLHLHPQGFLQQPPGALSQQGLQHRLHLTTGYRAVVDDDRRFFHERILLPVSAGIWVVCGHPLRIRSLPLYRLPGWAGYPIHNIR